MLFLKKYEKKEKKKEEKNTRMHAHKNTHTNARTRTRTHTHQKRKQNAGSSISQQQLGYTGQLCGTTNAKLRRAFCSLNIILVALNI